MDPVSSSHCLGVPLPDPTPYSIQSTSSGVLSTGDGTKDTIVPCGNNSSLDVSASGFTATENPFLFPSILLDRYVEDSLPENADGLSSRQSHNTCVMSQLEDDAIEDVSRWWLIHTKPRQEKKLSDQLSSLKVPHYLPVSKCKAVTRGRTRYSRLPQFPSYMFLWANSEQRRTSLQTNRIVATHIVQDEVKLGGQLWNLADLIEKGVPLRVEDRLASGQSVRVMSGLLRDKVGVIIKRGGKTRLFVFINELLGGVSLEIEQHLVEPY